MDPEGGLLIYNLGTGRGTSVLEMVAAFEAATGVKIPYEVVGRRPGDVAETWASVDKIARELGWTAKKGIDDMCADMWRWQQSGYAG
jgi:UDP-glucose 4-epimerase